MLQRASCKAFGDLCGCVLEAFWKPVEVSRRLLGTLSGILEPSCTRPGASCEHGGDISSALGAVGEAS